MKQFSTLKEASINTIAAIRVKKIHIGWWKKLFILQRLWSRQHSGNLVSLVQFFWREMLMVTRIWSFFKKIFTRYFLPFLTNLICCLCKTVPHHIGVKMSGTGSTQHCPISGLEYKPAQICSKSPEPRKKLRAIYKLVYNISRVSGLS